MSNSFSSRLMVVAAIALMSLMGLALAGDMMRKSIVFDIKTPDVFYCPQEKPVGIDQMMVKAKPLKKLCEFGGLLLPNDYMSDCYNDVDESEFACAEKKRIMIRLNPPNDTSNSVGDV